MTTDLTTGLVLAAIVLLAVVVGAAVPALVQLRKTLRAAELTLESSRPRLTRALDEVATAVATLNRTAGHVERGTAGLEHIVQSAVGVAESLESAGAKLRSTGALLGAVVAGLTAGARVMGGRERGVSPEGVPEGKGTRRGTENAEEVNSHE